MNIQINKIKLNKHNCPEIHLERWLNNASEDSKVTGDSSDETLTNEMQGLMPTLIECCCLDEDSWSRDGSGKGLTLKDSDSGIGIVISAQMKVSDSDGAYVVNINSPYLSSERLAGSEEMQVKRIQKAAKDYLDSLPQQGDLFAA